MSNYFRITADVPAGQVYAQLNAGARNNGIATFSGVTSVTVSHGLYSAPSLALIDLTPAGSAGAPWVTNITATQFTINTASSFTGTIGWAATINQR